MDVLRQNDVMNRKQLTANGTPRRLPSLKQPRAQSQGNMGTFHAARQMPFNPPIGGNFMETVPNGFTVGGTSMGLPHIVPPDHAGLETSHTDRSEWRKKRGVFSKASWYSAEDREKEREKEKEKEMNPEPMPFMSSVFKAPPLERVRVQGVPFPSLVTDAKSDTVSTKSKARTIASPTPSSNQARMPHNLWSDRSSTVIKKVSNRQRHAEMWGSPDYTGYTPAPQQGFAFHTDRYQFEDLHAPDQQSLRGGNEMAPSIEFIDRVSQMKYLRQRRLQPHHQPLNMLMGGKQVMMFERMDITDELRKLKSINLPKKAKDLYVGRGFKMPDHHAINKPRPTRNQTTPSNVTVSAPVTSMGTRLVHRSSPRASPRSKSTRAGIVRSYSKTKSTLGVKQKPQLSVKTNPNLPVEKDIAPKESNNDLGPQGLRKLERAQTKPAGSFYVATEKVNNNNLNNNNSRASNYRGHIFSWDIKYTNPKPTDYLKCSRTEFFRAKKRGYRLHVIPPEGMPSKAKTELYPGAAATKVESWSKTERVDEKSEDGRSSSLQNPQLPKVDVTAKSNQVPAKPQSATKSIKSAASRGSPAKATTPNPLKTGLVENFIESAEYEKLRKNFKRLDTDMDGHLMFNQLKTSLPKGISHAQERYIKQVYDITSSSTFFGINEYISMSIMCHRIASLDGLPREAFHKINFATLEGCVKQYADLFQSVDRSNSGKVSADSLKQILTMALDDKLTDEMFKEIADTMKITNDGVNKMDYLAYIPYFLLYDTLEVPASSISVHGD